MLKLFIHIPLVIAFLSGCPLVGLPQNEKSIDIRVDINRTHQVISNFAASDAWSCQFVGNWQDRPRNAIANWLFSMDTLANGSPQGIGLSLWRFNAGAGSARQEAASGIRDEWRRAESFLGEKGEYDWSRQQGQLWFLKAARDRGVKQFLGFFNSPPVPFTTNGKAYAANGKCNIDSTKYVSFARYAADMTKGIKQATGIELDYISPVNEPQWDWSDGGQEGCPYSNKEISGLARAFNTAFTESRLATKLLIAEAGHYKYLLDDADKPGKGNQVMAFFDPSSPCYIGHLPAVSKTMAAHGYFTSSPFAQAMTLRENIASRVAAVKGLDYWQSEYCILGDNAGEIDGRKRDLGMNTALYIARTIYADLVGGNATAWQWWLAISPYDYKDGLIYIDKNKTGGAYYDSKMLWAFGNYSRFVRPGMKRVEVAPPAAKDILVSAYKDERQKKLVLVIVNSGAAAQSVSIKSLPGHTVATRAKWDTYTTSDSKNLEKHILFSNTIDIMPRSIVTMETMYH